MLQLVQHPAKREYRDNEYQLPQLHTYIEKYQRQWDSLLWQTDFSQGAGKAEAM